MAISFDDYLGELSQLGDTVDPTMATPESLAIQAAADALTELPEVTRATLTAAIEEHPDWVPVLGLVVGLGQEKLKNALKHNLDTSGWVKLAKERPGEIIGMLDANYDLVRLLERQRGETYTFGHVLVARAGPRVTAAGGAAAGRSVEDAIEEVAKQLGLEYQVRTRFEGRGNRTAPCDIAIPGGGTDAVIVVAAKGFGSTGSKLTDAVREVEEMADVRRPNQYVMAVIDGIGWLNRKNDLRKIHQLLTTNEIDGMYTLSMFDGFRADVEKAARLRGLLN